MKKNIDIRPYTKQFYRGNIAPLLLALLQTFLSAAGNLLVAWLLQQILDLIGGCETGFTLGELTAITLVLVAGIAVTCMISYYSRPGFVAKGIAQYSQYIFDRLTMKKISAFSGENSSLYISALTNDIGTIEQGYLSNIFVLLTSVLTFVGALAMMLYYSPALTLVAIGLSLLPVLASVLAGGRIAKAEREVSDRNAAYTAALKDSLAGFAVIKSFKAELQMSRIFGENVRRLAGARCRREKMGILIQMFGSIAGVTAQLGVFLVGASLALSGKDVTVGTVMIFVQMMNYIIGPIGVIPNCLAERKAAKALIQKVAEALDTNLPAGGKEIAGKLEKGITLSHLSFSYEQDKEILKDISLCFEAGKSYAIVGASGSGKSTLLNLLMAAHGNYTGSILYDDTELRDISCDSLYDMVSIVQQNVFIFNASIRDNITMFSDFSREEVDRAIELSGLAGMIAERGEDYLCGENGSGLSGGEKQRISIARSLLKKSEVLLVDEATAALDAGTAFYVSNELLKLQGLTRIVVTHSLEEKLLRQYDCVLTLRNGRIAEEGSFEELMERKGYFYSLYTVSQQ